MTNIRKILIVTALTITTSVFGQVKAEIEEKPFIEVTGTAEHALAQKEAGTSPQSQFISLGESGVKVVPLISRVSPTLKVLLPGKDINEQGIDIEFPELVGDLFVIQRGIREEFPQARDNSGYGIIPKEKAKNIGYHFEIKNNTISYDMELKDSVHLYAKAIGESDGIRFTYTLQNTGKKSHTNIWINTCIQPELIKEFKADEKGRKMFVAVKDSGFVAVRHSKKGHSSNTLTSPFIASLSRDDKWIIAAYYKEAFNVWASEAWNCPHADPLVAKIEAGKSVAVQNKIYIFQGSLADLLKKTTAEDKRTKQQ